MKKKIQEEDGNMIVLFTAVFLVLIAFVGLSMDMGMLYMRRNNLNNLCDIIREYRFTHQDRIRYAKNPGEESYILTVEAMKNNDFHGKTQVYFYEKKPQPNERAYVFRAQLSEEFSFYFLRLFGMKTLTLKQSVDVIDTYGEGGYDRVWYPSSSYISYSGSYTGNDSAYHFTVGNIPDDLIPSGW